MTIKFDPMMLLATQIASGDLGKPVIFCIEEEKFYIFTDGYWKRLHDIQLAKIIMDSENLKHVVEHSLSKRNQILENLKQLVQKELSIFNQKGYLNFDFGEFDLTESYPGEKELGVWHDHDPEHYSTFRMPYKYQPQDCPLWKKTLSDIFEGDQRKIDILQEFFGYCLTKDVRKEKALLLLGESRTGKSTILETLSYMIGEDNCSFVSLDYIFHPQYSPLLMNKLVNIDTDVSAKAENFEREFKTITSGEPLVCNQKFVETFKFRPYCKLVLAANVFPKITDHSSAFYKRLILLPCDRVFEEHEQDILLKDKLTKELYGIFQWAVEGLRRLNERGGFEQHEFMKEAVKELEDTNNPSNIFFEEHVESGKDDEFFIEKGELFNHYKQWCVKTQNYTISARKFSQAIHKRYGKITPKDSQSYTTGKRIWRNLRYVENKGEIKKEEEIIQWQE